MSKLLKPEVHKKSKNRQSICHIKFCNQTVELINIPEILHNENVEAEVHKISAKSVSSTKVYELTNPIRSKILNVNDFFF